MPASVTIRRARCAAVLLALALPLAAPAQLPTPMSEMELRALLLARGFTDIEAVVFDDGLWSATATAPDGGRAALHVHPSSSAVFLDDVEPELDAEQVTERLTSLGYQHVHSPRFEDGVWKVDAESAAGVELRLYVDPVEGAVLAEFMD